MGDERSQKGNSGGSSARLRKFKHTAAPARNVAILPRRPAQVASAEQMYVQVEHRLAGLRADVQYRSVTIFDFPVAGYFRCGQMAASDDLGFVLLRFLQTTNVFLGHDKDVRRRLWVDVFEGKGVLVFVDFLRRDLAGDDLAKKTIFHKNPVASDSWFVTHDSWVVKFVSRTLVLHKRVDVSVRTSEVDYAIYDDWRRKDRAG